MAITRPAGDDEPPAGATNHDDEPSPRDEAAAAVELATPERERWIVRADHRGAHDRMTVHLELATGSDDEVDRGIAVLQPIATRGEVS